MCSSDLSVEDRVDITVKDNIIAIAAVKNVVKKKWADFKPTGKKEKVILFPNKFDENDWTW